jgi:hypothetical protein
MHRVTPDNQTPTAFARVDIYLDHGTVRNEQCAQQVVEPLAYLKNGKAISAAELAEQTEWVRAHWENATPLYARNEIVTTYYIVQLEPDVWLAPWDGDPGRTEAIENAKRFPSRKAAEKALDDARTYRSFWYAFIDRMKATVI